MKAHADRANEAEEQKRTCQTAAQRSAVQCVGRPSSSRRVNSNTVHRGGPRAHVPVLVNRAECHAQPPSHQPFAACRCDSRRLQRQLHCRRKSCGGAAVAFCSNARMRRFRFVHPRQNALRGSGCDSPWWLIPAVNPNRQTDERPCLQCRTAGGGAQPATPASAVRLRPHCPHRDFIVADHGGGWIVGCEQTEKKKKRSFWK